jgi:hypothetical protein
MVQTQSTPRTGKKGTNQMRYKATFIAGLAAGFVAGSRAGRGAYDQLVKYVGEIAGHPKVQQATNTVQAKASDLAKQAAAKAPDYAKNAANTAVKTAQEQAAQVPGYVSTAKQAAASKIPARFGGTAGADAVPDAIVADPLTDDVAADGSLIYPADGGSPSVNGTRYTPDTD